MTNLVPCKRSCSSTFLFFLKINNRPKGSLVCWLEFHLYESENCWKNLKWCIDLRIDVAVRRVVANHHKCLNSGVSQGQKFGQTQHRYGPCVSTPEKWLLQKPFVKNNFQTDSVVYASLRQELNNLLRICLHQSCNNQNQTLHNWGHSWFVNFVYCAHQQTCVNFRLNLVDYLYHKITQAYGCLLIGFWVQKFFSNNDYLLCSHLLKDLSACNTDKCLECCRALQQQEHVLALVNVVK